MNNRTLHTKDICLDIPGIINCIDDSGGYREARSGVLDVQDSTKLVWILSSVGKVIEGSDLEKRIEILEGKA